MEMAGVKLKSEGGQEATLFHFNIFRDLGSQVLTSCFSSRVAGVSSSNSRYIIDTGWILWNERVEG